MPLYIYRCAAGHATEVRQRSDVRVIECGCGMVAERQTFYATQIGGRARTPVGERKISVRAFTEASEQVAYQHEQAVESAQREVPGPQLWKAAKARAAALSRAGITDSLDMRKGVA